MLNFQGAPFDIITLRDEAQKVAERRPMTSIFEGKCNSVHPLSHFNNLTRVTAPNHNKDYQRAINSNQNVFRRTNGPFTEWFNDLKT